jgi:hypothetical protein
MGLRQQHAPVAQGAQFCETRLYNSSAMALQRACRPTLGPAGKTAGSASCWAWLLAHRRTANNPSHLGPCSPPAASGVPAAMCCLQRCAWLPAARPFLVTPGIMVAGSPSRVFLSGACMLLCVREGRARRAAPSAAGRARMASAATQAACSARPPPAAVTCPDACRHCVSHWLSWTMDGGVLLLSLYPPPGRSAACAGVTCGSHWNAAAHELRAAA